jgi:ABC-type uncharacterized transport system involved in gliding motility auxiliary subunit
MNWSRLLKLGEKRKGVIFLIVLVAAIAVNILIQPIGLRLDLSKNKAYTLSDSSKGIIRNMNNKAKLTFFVSKDLPTRLVPFKRDITDLLNEYKQSSGGNILVEIKDPKTDDKARETAVKNGINEVRFSQLEQDKFNVSTGYIGILVSYNGQDKAIPQVTDVNNLEYNITSTIFSMARKDTPKIGFVGTEAAFNPQGGDPMSGLRGLLQQQYTVENVSLAAPQGAPPDIDAPSPTPAPALDIDPAYKTVLIFDTPPKKYSNDEIERIKKYLDKKGKAVVFMNGVGVDEQLIATQEATSNLFGLTQDYGIKVNKDLVLSTDAELINYGSGVSQFYIPYPFWIKATQFNSASGFFSNVNTLTFPWVSSLSVEKKNGFDVQEIIRTNDRSWLQKDQFDLDPQKAVNSVPSQLSQYILGAVSTKKDGGSLMVIPSSRFVMNNFISQQSSNLNFMLNVISNFASGGALSGIRQRAVDVYPLPALSDAEQSVFKYTNMLVLPFLFAAFGAYYLWKRK